MTAPRRLGKYELVAKIGEGGMAEVHLARQRGPKRFQKLVVLKLVHSKLASKPAVAEALLDEARIAALVKHPNVVDIYDLGEEKGNYFIAMEYLDGESLAAILKASRSGVRLDPFSTARIIADCAAGLHAAHELRDLKGDPLELVHQDVTPGNVIVLYGGQVKLVDFGVAKVRTSEDAGLVKGKAGYLAPELFDGAAADRRSDVWALGVVLWESLVLRRLFAAKSEEETFARIRSGVIDAPSKYALAVTKDLDDVCMKALARDPTLRYQTARAMQDDLVAVLRHANWSGDSEPIARFMRMTFATQISARQEVLRDLAAREDPRPEAIELMTAHDKDAAPSTPPRADELVEGSHGAVRLPTSPGATPAADGELELLEGSAVQLEDPAGAKPRRRAWLVGAAAAAALLVIILFATRGSRRVEPSLAGAASATGSAAPVAAPTADIDARLEEEQIEIEPVPVPVPEVDAGVVVTDVRPVKPTKPVKPTRDDDRSEPTSARALYKDGLGRYVAGDTGGAIDRFQDALARDPRYAPAHRGLGMAYEKKGDRSRAARSFKKYLELAPQASDAVQIRARLAKL
ncbi:MAG TPA: protein kinase [Kofleriaceae bacterium]|nr:protein kinase [Kofleriaceae bacterium]